MRAVVVGGGIGGLSAAIGLHRAGWDIRVLERAPQFGEVGAGLTLWPNALRALESLGLADHIAEVATPQRSGGMRRTDGKWLSRWDGAGIVERLGRPMLGVHRAALHRMLLDELPPDALHAGLSGKLEDLDADLIVGADGIDSSVRRALFPSHPAPVYSGATAWRGVCAPPGDVDVAITWGRGMEAGVVPLVDGRIYWYVSTLAPEGVRYADEKAHVLDLVRGWHDPIPGLIETTPAEAVLHHDLRHLARPLPSYVSDRVALLGDAAHAMTPNLGQGGCQAIEDAAVLASVAASRDPVPVMLAEYDRLRRPRSQQVARMSARIGRFSSNLSNPALVWLRDTAMRLTPQRIALKSMTGVADWTPPSP